MTIEKSAEKLTAAQCNISQLATLAAFDDFEESMAT